MRAASAPWASLTVAVMLGVCALPLAGLVLLATADGWPTPSLLPTGFRLDRFATWTERGLAASATLSLALASGVALASTGIGWAASRAMASATGLVPWARLAFVPFALSPVVIGVCLVVPFLVVGWAGTIVGVALAHLAIASAFAALALLEVWTPEREQLAEVAATLGASPLDVWLRVLLPASWPFLRVCLFQTFLISWTQYGLTLVIGSGKVRTLPLRVYDSLFEADPGQAAVAALLLALPPLVLVALGQVVPGRPS